MELIIKEYEKPSAIEFNFEELKKELTEKADLYATVVYDEEHIKQAKDDRASLNKLKKALNDERLRREKEYMQPFNEFKAKIDEIIKIIDKPVMMIDRQVKEAEEKRKADKRLEIGQLWNTTEHPEWLTLPRIFNEKWLNVTFSMKAIAEEINERLAVIVSDMATLESLTEFNIEAMEDYKRNLDIGHAIAEGQRLSEIAQKRKAYEEQKKQEEDAKKVGEEFAAGFVAGVADSVKEDFMPLPVTDEDPEDNAEWTSFRALLTVPQAIKLNQFFKTNGIKFEAI